LLTQNRSDGKLEGIPRPRQTKAWPLPYEGGEPFVASEVLRDPQRVAVQIEEPADAANNP
jgi:hypothetical protein